MALWRPVGDESRPLLLSVDFEDWHQLMRRRIGIEGWERPGPALQRQTERLLALLDELGVKATFFVLGMTGRSYPSLVERIVASGHEIGCHGDMHQLVSGQNRDEFAADLREACRTIEELTGRRPVGYRAPAFSITRDAEWAYEVLTEEGFGYDASQHDSPRIRGRMVPLARAPHPLQLRAGVLWEFPIAVWRGRNWRVPVGGASYWAVLPRRLILRALADSGELAALYLHPHELDPLPLRACLAHPATTTQRVHGQLRSAQRNLARRRAPEVLRAIAKRHPLITYGEAHGRLARGPSART